MPRISRIVAVDYPHHITQRGVRSMDIFHSDHDRNQYFQFIKEDVRKCEIEILAWCLMTNHVHFIRYVENNPVAAGMTKHVWPYKWSSAAYHVGKN